MIGNNFVPPNNFTSTFLFFILQIIKGKEVVIERERPGEEIYAKDSMKLQGVQKGKINFRALAKFV